MGSPKRTLQGIEERLADHQDVSLTVFLAVLCLLSFGLLPFLEWSSLTGKLIAAAYSLLFVAGAFIGGLSGKWRRAAILLAGISILSAWVGDGYGTGFWAIANLITSTVFMAFVCLLLTREVFRPGEVNGHRIRGAVAVYLLVGFIFALLYGLMEQLVPGSFQGLGPDGFGADLHSAIYFSMVTLTTLGFGDITPVSQLAQNIVVVEAIIGQLYLVVLIGRLVSLSMPRKKT